MIKKNHRGSKASGDVKLRFLRSELDFYFGVDAGRFCEFEFLDCCAGRHRTVQKGGRIERRYQRGHRLGLMEIPFARGL